MAISFVNTSNGSVLAGGTTLTSGTFALTGGNFVAVFLRGAGTNIPSSVIDSAGNTYTKAVFGSSGDAVISDIWFTPNAAALASAFVTANYVGTAGDKFILTGQYSGLDTSPLDGTAGGNSTTTTAKGTLTTIAGSTLVVMVTASFPGAGGTLSTTSPWTLQNQVGTNGALREFGYIDQIVGTAAQYIGSITNANNSGNSGVAIASFKNLQPVTGGFLKTSKYW